MPSDDRVSVTTHVPEHQRDEWREHANALDMSQSEFVRSMVQAGRRDFTLQPVESTNPEEPQTPTANPRGDALNTRILESIETIDQPDTDAILEELSDNLESRVTSAIEKLQANNRIRYNGTNRCYERIEPDS